MTVMPMLLIQQISTSIRKNRIRNVVLFDFYLTQFDLLGELH